MKDDSGSNDNGRGDEGVEHQLGVMKQMNDQGKVLGIITVVWLKDKELSFHIAGEFDTLSNQLGMLEQAKEACKLYAAQKRANRALQSNPSWGPGGNA